MRRLVALALLLLAAAGLPPGGIAATSDDAGSSVAVYSPHAPQVIALRAGEDDSVYYFAPAEVQLRPGAVRVEFSNEGARSHTFNVKRPDEWRDLYNFPLVQAGDSSVFEFELWESGSYVFYCQLYKHVDHGQTGVILVSPG